MPQLRYDPICNGWVPRSSGDKPKREAEITMFAHDCLPLQWRALSRMVQGRTVERQYKRGAPESHVIKVLNKQEIDLWTACIINRDG